jgi:histidyl-tRNA synthetase
MAADKLSTEPYKGVRDFYPEEHAVLSYFFATCRSVLERAGYVEYGASILEPAELYKAKGAENEEIVSEQTYTFTDRGGREVTLRPEMTPTVARMVAAKRREMGYPLRLFSLPNLFRYERTQRGRLREHWQLNIDLFGSHSPYADAEIIGIAYGIMKAFGASDEDFVIKVGSRAYLNGLIKELGLSDEASRRFVSLLDKKAKMPHEEFEAALREVGVGEEKLRAESPPDEAAAMMSSFKDADINNIVFDPSIVRGFAYYTGMVFEVFDTSSENNRSLFGGGRYDNLTQLFDSEPLPGVGFGMGDVTLRDFLETHGLLPAYKPPTDLYIAVTAPELAKDAQTLAGELRQGGVNVAIDFGEKKLADQIKSAAKHQIPHLIVLGEDELASGHLRLRDLASGEERELARAEIVGALKT